MSLAYGDNPANCAQQFGWGISPGSGEVLGGANNGNSGGLNSQAEERKCVWSITGIVIKHPSKNDHFSSFLAYTNPGTRAVPHPPDTETNKHGTWDFNGRFPAVSLDSLPADVSDARGREAADTATSTDASIIPHRGHSRPMDGTSPDLNMLSDNLVVAAGGPKDVPLITEDVGSDHVLFMGVFYPFGPGEPWRFPPGDNDDDSLDGGKGGGGGGG